MKPEAVGASPTGHRPGASLSVLFQKRGQRQKTLKNFEESRVFPRHPRNMEKLWNPFSRKDVVRDHSLLEYRNHIGLNVLRRFWVHGRGSCEARLEKGGGSAGLSPSMSRLALSRPDGVPVSTHQPSRSPYSSAPSRRKDSRSVLSSFSPRFEGGMRRARSALPGGRNTKPVTASRERGRAGFSTIRSKRSPSRIAIPNSRGSS